MRCFRFRSGGRDPTVPASRPIGRTVSGRAPPGALLLALGVFLSLTSCAVQAPRRAISGPSSASALDQRSPFLKVHLRDGGVCILGRWRLVLPDSVMVGEGRRYDAHREFLFSGAIQVPLDSVALFETNTLTSSSATGPLVAMSVLTGIIAMACVANPKACFGSCPTYYVNDGRTDRLMAEGFSSSIAPALEATDLDALYRAGPRDRDFVIRMTNEALETHVIRHADILAAARPPGGRVLATPAGVFLEARALHEPEACTGVEGDILALVRAFDGWERNSSADSTDLATRETIDLLVSPSLRGPIGVVIAARQSLMSTYIFYQGLAWLGSSAVAALAALERGGEVGRRLAGGVGAALGGIEVQVPDGAGGYRTVGEVGETGPLATDLKVVPLPIKGVPDGRLRLWLTRGHWRIDYLAIAELGPEIRPIRCRPVRVERGGRTSREELAALLDSTRTLITLPGDAVSLHYRLPADPAGLELFLESRGYYLEWLREAWLAEEDSERAAQLFLDPRGTLRRMAPEFKRHEAGLDSTFWRSRYAHP